MPPTLAPVALERHVGRLLGTCDKACDRDSVGGTKAAWVGVDVTTFQSSAPCGSLKGGDKVTVDLHTCQESLFYKKVEPM